MIKLSSTPTTKSMSKVGGVGSLLHSYAEAGQLLQLEQELNQDLTKIDSKNMYGDTPLLWACEANQYDACVLLLQSGANIHEKNKFTGASSLHKACEKGYFELCQLLISCGANVEEKNKDGDGPLHVASEGGYVKIVLLLIENGADIAAKGNFGNTPLHVACTKGNDEVALTLIAYGANIHEKDSDQRAPIHKVASEGHHILLSKLIEYGADIHDKDKDEDTPLHIACEFGHTEIVLYLINSGCRVDEKSKDGSVPLHLACRWGRSDIVNILINHSASIHSENVEGSTPLHSALTDSSNIEIAKQLVYCGASIHVKNKSDVSPIDLIDDEAVKEDLVSYYNEVNNKVSKRLFADEVPVSEATAAPADSDEGTYFDNINSTVDVHSITRNGNILSLQTVLIQYPERMSELNTNGENILHVACRYGHGDIVRYVLSQSTMNLLCKSKNGITPLHFASYKGHVEIVQQLVKYGVNIHEKDNGGSTPLHVACANNHEPVARYLILQGASISEPNGGGNSSMDLIRDSALRRDLIEYYNHVNVAAVAASAEEQTEDYMASMTASSAQITKIKSEFIAHFYDTFITEEVTAISQECRNEIVGERNARLKAKREKAEKLRLKEELSDIHTLAEKGKVSDLVQELSANPDRVNEIGAYGNTPIHRACRWGQRDVVKVLLDISGININIKNNSGFLPIHYACDYGNKDILILLLCQSNIRLNEKSNSGETPLHRAVLKGSQDIVEILVMNKININDRNADGKTSLHIACYNDYKEISLLLIQHGAIVDCCDNDGKTPIDLLRDAEVGKELVAYALEVKRTNRIVVEQNIIANSNTPFKSLIALIQANKHDEVEENISQFVDVLNYKDTQGVTPLIYACQGGNLAIVRLLVDNNADLEMIDEAGFTPLHYASARGEVEVVQLLLNKGVNSNVAGNIDGNTATAGDTPLHWSVFNNQIQVTKLLLAHRANINQRNNLGFTPLHHACSKPYIEMANLLLLNNAPINRRSEEGFTPLHLACRTDSKAIVLLLIDRGANKQERDEYGNTPLHHACMKSNKVIIKLLVTLDVSVKEKNKNGKEPYDLITSPDIRAGLDEFTRSYHQEKLLMMNQGSGGTNSGKSDRSILAFNSIVNSPSYGMSDLSRAIQSPIGIYDREKSFSNYPPSRSLLSPVSESNRPLFQMDEEIVMECDKLVIKGLLPFPTLSTKQKVGNAYKVNGSTSVNVINNGLLKGYMQLPVIGERREVIVKEESYLLSSDIKIRDIVKEGEMYEYIQKLTKDNADKDKYNGLVEMYGYSVNSIPRYLVIEYFGHDLAYEFASTVEVRHIIFNNLLLALQHLHSCGVVHGNLNPNNILVSRQSHYKVKFCDLGNARKEGEVFPSTDDVFTTSPSWISPEIYHGRPGVLKCTKAMDMFTIGLLGRLLLVDEAVMYNEESMVIFSDNLEKAMNDQGYLNSLVVITSDEYLSRLMLSLVRLNPHERLNINDIIDEIHSIPSKRKQLEEDMKAMHGLISKSESILPRAINTAIGTFATGVEKNLIVKINEIVRSKEEDIISRLLSMIEENEGPLLERIATLINDENAAKLEQLNTLVLHNQSVINDKFSKYFMAEKDSLKEEVVELREENHILSGKLGTAEARVVEKSKIVDELNATIKGLHDAMHDLVIKHEVEKKSIVDVTIDEQMAVSNEAIKVLSAVLQETQNEMTKKVADIRELYGTNHKYSEHIVELKEELAVVTDRYDRCKEDLDHCKSSQLALGNKVDELKDQLVRKDLEFEGAKLRIHEEALKMDSSENNAMIRMMSDNLKDSHAEMAMKEEEIKTLVVNITKLEAELIGKNNRISELGQQRAADANEYRTRTNDAITALNNTLLDLKQQLSHSFEENHILLGKFHQLEVELASSNTRCTEYVLSIDAHKRQIQDLKDTILELRVTIEQNRIKFEGEKQVLLENMTSKNSESVFERVESKLSHLNAAVENTVTLHRNTESKLSHINSSIEQINATTVTLHRDTENRLSRRVGNIIVSGILHNNVRELYDKYCFYFFVGVACLLTYYCWSMNFFLDMYQPSTHTGGDSATNVGSYDPDDVGVNYDSIFSSDDRIGSSNSKFTFGRNNIKYI